MKILTKLVTLLILFSIVTQGGNCYAGRPENCFVDTRRKYKCKQIFDGKKFVREYVSKGLEFLGSPFFINQVAYIPFTELLAIVDSPSVRFYFYDINRRHINAFKDNPLALVKFIVDNERFYKLVVSRYLDQNPHLINWKKRCNRLIKLGNALKDLSIGNEVLNLIQIPVDVPEEMAPQVPVPPTSELNETKKKTPIPSIFSLLSEIDETSGNFVPQIPHLI